MTQPISFLEFQSRSRILRSGFKSLLLSALVLILFITSMTITASAQGANQNSSTYSATTINTQQQSSLPKSSSVKPKQVQSPVFQGSVTTLNVFKGRSQIIKFAQPIARVSLADPTIADVVALAPDQLMVNGRQRGVTSFIVWDETGQEGIFDLVVQNDTSELLSEIDRVAPNENIHARVTDDSFILTGSVTNSVVLDQIRQLAHGYGYREDKFIDLTDTPQTQVSLKVKIVQMSRSLARTIKSAFQFSVENDLSVWRLPFPYDSSGSIRPIAANANNEGGLTGVLDFGTFLQTAFDFQDVEGKVTVLAEPELITTHGRPAHFLAGGEFPFISGVALNGGVNIQFKEFGVKLDFTPWVNTASELIELKIAPEVSSIDNSFCVDTASGDNSQLVCGILKRRTETTVQLHNGEALMISGILTREENDSFRKIPFIGDLPILGRLFKNSETDHTDTELMVLVVPTILDRNHHTGQSFDPTIHSGPRGTLLSPHGKYSKPTPHQLSHHGSQLQKVR